MTNAVIRPGFPDILILAGDAYNPANLLQGVIDAVAQLSDTPGSPISNGSHDFWIVHGIPSLGGTSQFFSGDANTQPRPFRGFIYMSSVPGALSIDEMQSYLSTLAQEVAHYWLVPGDLKIKVGSNILPLARDVELTQQINDDTPFTNLPLLARANSHWSVYWQADGSPMDGICYDAVSTVDGYTGWRSSLRCFPPITLDEALPPIRFARYCDLDRLVMGVMTPDEAYRGSAITWMQPRLTESVESHSGLVVIFAKDDQLLFGFDMGHLTLRVRNTRGDSLGVATIIPDYHPLAHDLNGMRLRVIRQQNNYYFQAKIDNPAGGCLATVLSAFGLNVGTPGNLWDGYDQPGPPNAAREFREWKTVAVVPHDGEPLAVGAAVNKWKHPHLCDAAFYRFEFKQGSNEWGHSTDSVPPPIPPLLVSAHTFGPQALDEYSRVPSGSLCRQEQDGAIFRARNGQIHIIAPFSRVVNGVLHHLGADAFHHGVVDGQVIDHSPKILTRPPAGDFGFAVHAKIHRTIVTPWAGGYANNKLVFGKTQSARASDVQLSNAMRAKQDVPPGHAYRMAFIIAVRDADFIDNDTLHRLDIMRSYWSVLFADATLGRRLVDTSF